MNLKVYVACNFNYWIEIEGLRKMVAGVGLRHCKSGNISESETM